MNNRFLASLILGALPLTMLAQDDDMYFVPSKKNVERSAYSSMPRSTYYSGSNRDVDEYNRRGSYYQVLSNDTTGNDIINFSAERGVYPDSTQTDDYSLTRQMSRYDGYDPYIAYSDGYRDGRYDEWRTSSWYYPWYDSYWYWNDPWYYRGYGWHYSTWYGPRYYGWYGPRYYYSYRPYGGWRGTVRSTLYSRNGNTGTINLSGRSHGRFTGGSRQSSTSSRATRRSTYNSNNSNVRSSTSSTVYRSNSGNLNRSSSIINRSSSSGSFGRSGGGFSGGGFSGGGSRGGGSIGRAGRR